MKHLYFYSPLYEFYHQHITQTLGPHFDLEGILIDDMNNSMGHPFAGGVTTKIELLIQKIPENMGSHIVFSDATILVHADRASELHAMLDAHKDCDMCFADNAIDSLCNIGYILIHCSEKTLSFFRGVLAAMQVHKRGDQGTVNDHLLRAGLRVGKFPRHLVVCGYAFDQRYKDTHLLFKSFLNHTTDATSNFNARLQLFLNSGLISETTYKEWSR
jgi:hypothetical protein